MDMPGPLSRDLKLDTGYPVIVIVLEKKRLFFVRRVIFELRSVSRVLVGRNSVSSENIITLKKVSKIGQEFHVEIKQRFIKLSK